MKKQNKPACVFKKECRWAKVYIPRRATPESAGYDFFMPRNLTIKAGETAALSTGVIADLAPGYVLMLFPRSSLGIQGLEITNTVGIIDADFKLPITAFLKNNGMTDICRESSSSTVLRGTISRSQRNEPEGLGALDDNGETLQYLWT